MPVSLNFLERLFMMKLNKGPAPFLDIMGGFSFYAIYSAIKLNLFEELDKNPNTVPEMAHSLGCTKRGLAVLLDVLETLGYIKKKGQIYINTRMTKKWMLEKSAMNFSKAFMYYGDSMADLWPHLHQTVVNGSPHLNFYDWLKDHPDSSQQYQQFLMTLAKTILPEIPGNIGLKNNPRQLLDIGGGHGLYSIALCQRYDSLSATIFDSPYSQAIAAENIKAANLEDRIRFMPGNYNSDDLGSGYDIALLFNVIHEHTDEENIKLVKRVSQALKTNGCLIIMDIIREKKLTGMMDLFARTYGLIFFLFLGGQNYSFAEISSWLTFGGFAKIMRKNLRKSGINLIISQKS